MKRDSFYSGVSEGVVNTDRLITMLNVKNDECFELAVSISRKSTKNYILDIT